MAAIDEFVSGLKEIEQEIPQTCKWNAQDLPCSASRASRGGKLEISGFGNDEDLVVILRGELFPDAGPFPIKSHTLVFEGTTYRIDKVLTAPERSFLRLSCVNPNRGL